jgi:alginate O-acetyltransferase complex protein AlgI
MLLCIGVSHMGGFVIAKTHNNRIRFFVAAIAISFNLGFLLYFKYTSFFLAFLSRCVENLGHTPLSVPEILLPIGISFFVFQSISYIVDVYRDESPAQGNIFNTALYISLFPQLIAGPIIRYNSLSGQFENRDISLVGYSEGLTRFCFGLGKKVLLANQAGAIADLVFGLPLNELTMPLAWLGALAYSVQIYFDFSGYSDMAIGIGRTLGFTFPENFNYPYVAKTITEFWRRWHISLSSWFKDYVYIPLGGNRKGPKQMFFNLFAVFVLTGFWHGANWTFLLWGLWHGLFIVLEKYLKVRVITPHPTPLYLRILKWIYCFFVVLLGWVLFRSNTWRDAGYYIQTMFNPYKIELDMLFLSQINGKTLVIFLSSIPIGAGLLKRLCIKTYIGPALAVVVLGLSYVVLVSSAYNPFIYFRF